MTGSDYIRIALAFVVAGVAALAMTPLVKKFAFKVGAVDIPRTRHIHTQPTALLGGLAIFIGFLLSVLVFGTMDRAMTSVLLGTLIIVAVSALDDIYDIPAWIRLIVHFAAASIPVFYGGLRIDMLSTLGLFGTDYIILGSFSVPITLVWIVGMTNAINWIDGLDGLAAGVSSISAMTLLVISCLLGDPYVAIIMAALAGACIGFLPFNLNPAKIFMGDTGAMFLGFVLATMSIQGLFKFYVVISFAVPFLMLGIPILDLVMSVSRRIIHHQSPMVADRAHMHHRLIDMGFNQKQVVAILYCLSAILGIAAVVLAASGEIKAILLLLAVLLAAVIGIRVMAAREQPRDGDTESGDTQTPSENAVVGEVRGKDEKDTH